MDLNRIKLFYHVATAKSFTKAAEQLYTSQSALSRQIIILEQRLKVRLFQRSAKGLILTQEGEKLFEISQKIISEANTIEDRLFGDQNSAKDTLKVTTTVALASMWLPYYVSDFFKQSSQTKLTIIGDDNELDLNIRKADASIRPILLYQKDHIQRYLTTFQLKLYASQSYIDEFGEPKKIEDLNNHRLIVFGNNTMHPYGNINWLLNVGKTTQKLREPFMRINVGPGLLQMAKQGIGIVALSKEYPGIQEMGLVNILPEIEGPAVDIYYTYPEASKDIQKIKIFGDYLESVFY